MKTNLSTLDTAHAFLHGHKLRGAQLGGLQLDAEEERFMHGQEQPGSEEAWLNRTFRMRGTDIAGKSLTEKRELIFQQHAIRNAISTGDDPTGGVVNVGFEKTEWPSTFERFTTVKKVQNFQEMRYVQARNRLPVQTVGEGQPVPSGSMVAKTEKGTLESKALICGVSREIIVNQGALAGLVDIGAQGKRALKEQENNDCFATFTDNPTMNEDSATLFNATATSTAGGHGNLVNPGAVVGTGTLDAAFSAMSTCPVYGSAQDAYRFTGLLPKFLLVPSGMRSAALTAAAGNLTPEGERLEVVLSPYLQVHDSSAWYCLADPAQSSGMVQLVLAGHEEPEFVAVPRPDASPLGIYYRLLFDYKFMIGDWRPWYKNAGK